MDNFRFIFSTSCDVMRKPRINYPTCSAMAKCHHHVDCKQCNFFLLLPFNSLHLSYEIPKSKAFTTLIRSNQLLEIEQNSIFEFAVQAPPTFPGSSCIKFSFFWSLFQRPGKRTQRQCCSLTLLFFSLIQSLSM